MCLQDMFLCFFFLNINNNGFVFPFIQKDVWENFSFNLYSLKKMQRRMCSAEHQLICDYLIINSVFLLSWNI